MRSKDLLANLRVISTTFELYLKQQAVDLFIIFTVIVQPFLVALLAIFMFREEAADSAIFLVVGSAMTGLWSGLLFTSSFSINGERWMGTLEMVVGSPTPLAVVILGKTLANVAISFGFMPLCYAMAAFTFRFPVSIAHPFLFLISVLLTVVAFVSLGLVIAPFLAVSLSMQGWVNALEFPMYILGGFLFPILMLPRWTNPISYALAPYWAAQALHATSSGGVPLTSVLLDWGTLMAFSMVYIFLAARLFQIVLRRARIEATLSLQ